mgnify:FL=1
MGMLMIDVTGMEKTSVTHQIISHTHPARQAMPSGAIPAAGGRSLMRKHANGPRTKQSICFCRGESLGGMSRTSRVHRYSGLPPQESADVWHGSPCCSGAGNTLGSFGRELFEEPDCEYKDNMETLLSL